MVIENLKKDSKKNQYARHSYWATRASLVYL